MNLKISSSNPLLPFPAEKYYIPVDVCTREEMVDYLSDLATSKNLEMLFYTDDYITYAYFEDKKICYYLITKEEPVPPVEESTEESSLADRKYNPSVDRTSIFVKGLIAIMLFLTTLMPANSAEAYFFRGELIEEAENYPGLSKARFNTPSGATVIPGYISRATDTIYSDLAFSYLDPRRLQHVNTVSNAVFPGGNEDLVTAILAYRIKHNLGQIQEETGLSVSDRQVTEATQLALWLHAATAQIDYQIDANSIADPAVRTLATNITTWATKQVTNGSSTGLINYIFPVFTPKIDTRNSKMETIDSSVFYGPYVIQSQKGVVYSYDVPGGTVVDTSKKRVDNVVVGQQFYIQYPLSYTGAKGVSFSGTQIKYSLMYQMQRLWLHQEQKADTIRFSLGQSTGTQGTIIVKAKDSITGKAVPAVTVEVVKGSPQDTLLTAEDGETSYQTEPGKYTLNFIVPQGYMQPDPIEVDLAFAGDIQTVHLDLAWTQAVINFFAVDAATLSPTGDSEAFIYDSKGKAVKRVALKNGSVKGIVLPEGDYLLVQYKTSNNYALNQGVPFKAVAGSTLDVTVPQDANTMPTVITVKGAAPTDSWVYTVSNQDNVLFRMNSNNKLELPLPNGAYSVKAQKSDGTQSAGPLAFKTSLNGETQVELDTVKGEETVTFNVVDTKTGNPIPDVTLGIFDENHTLLKYATANGQGHVSIDGIVKHRIYYVNVLAAPDSVSGYSAAGNRFLGATRTFELPLYSLKEIQEVTQIDTIYRVPNITYAGATYSYPE